MKLYEISNQDIDPKTIIKLGIPLHLLIILLDIYIALKIFGIIFNFIK